MSLFEQSTFHRQLIKFLLILLGLQPQPLIWVYQLLHTFLISTQPLLQIQRIHDLLTQPLLVQFLHTLRSLLSIGLFIANTR